MDAITEFRCKTQAMSISSNAKQNLLAVGTIKGEVSCIKLSSNTSQEIPNDDGAVERSGASSGNGEKSDLALETSFTIRPSKKCCRAVSFNEPGSILYSGFKDTSIQGIDLTNQAITWNIPEAHSCPLNTLKVLSNNLLASGDEKGQVKIIGALLKVWDIRQVKECHTFLDNEDYIADMTYAERKKTLIAAGGDGYLSIFDLRKSVLLARSDNIEDELLSVVIVKNGTKVLCGTQLGIVCLFNWGDWGDFKDRFVGHPSSIEAMAVIDQDTICTGASDGLVRICSILPNKMLGIVADHQGFPVERLTITGVDQHDRWLATCSHDEIVRIFDISFLYQQQQEQKEDGSDKEEEEVVVKNNKRMLKPMKNPQKLRKKQELDEFFADL